MTEATFVPEEHMRRKREEYWADLVGGVTGAFKTQQVSRLLDGRTLPADSKIVDVGAGTSDLSKMLAEMGGLEQIVCLDYDAPIVEEMAAKETDARVEWRVGDARDLGSWDERVGAVTFFDILHEVYSFVGRSGDDPLVDHDTGIAAVEEILAASAKVLAPGGIIVITDDVLPEEEATVRLRCRTPEVVDVVKRVQTEYRSRDLEISWTGDDQFEIPAQKLATLLTQYNKPKRGDEARWAVEQMEIHQYMRPSDYERVLGAHGMTVHLDLGTADVVADEWNADFEILGGLPDGFPPKRVAVVAVK